jgi:NADH:ubiquinone oxidoreductase subunit 4 (subunit M)
MKGLALVQAIAMLGMLAILYRAVHRATGTWSFDYTTWCSIVLPQSSQLAGLGLLAIGLLAPLAMVATGMGESRAWPGGSLLFTALSIELFAFGMLRYGLVLFPLAWQQLAPLFAGLAVAGIVLGSLLANRQGDPELWAARAWVGQLGFVLLGIVTATPQTVLGAVLQTLAQGLSCAGLYLTITALQRRGPAEQLGGLKPYLVLVFLAASGLPGLCGFVGEFLIILGGWRARGQWDEMQLAPLYMRADIVAVIVALAALAYAVGFVRMLAHLASGRGGSAPGASHRLTWGERVAFPVVLVAMLGLGLLPGKILNRLSYPVASVLVSARARAADARSHAADPAHRFEPPAARAAGDLLRVFD